MNKFFGQLSPDVQRRIIKITIIAFMLFVASTMYKHVPILIRVFAFPAFFIGTYLVASKISPQMFGSAIERVESVARKIHPALKKVPGMAFLGILLVVSFMVAGFLWYWPAGVK